MSVKPSITGPFIRMLDASAGVLTQPKGSVPRLSNLLGSKRGSLRTCDGTAIVNAFLATPTLGRGKAMCDFFFEPAGVAPYYLRIMKALDQPLGAPQNLVATDAGVGGSFPAGTYFWKVTALDGAGGETTVSNEVTFTQGGTSHKITLSWNIVPNAISYNVYQGGISGLEFLLFGKGLPVPQPAPGTLSVSITLDGTAVANQVLSITSISGVAPNIYSIILAANATAPVSAHSSGTVTGNSNGTLNSSYAAFFNQSANVWGANGPNISTPQSGTGGTLTLSVAPPNVDTTQQTALYGMTPSANGIYYDDFNIFALWPADLNMPTKPVDGFPGGGGGTGGSGTHGSGTAGSTPSGGLNGNVTMIPQIVQFTNQAAIALGNGFAAQVFSDTTGTPTNPAPLPGISSISVDAFGVVTIQTTNPHGLDPVQGLGSNVYIVNVPIAAYNNNGNNARAFPVIAIPDSTHLKIVNLNAIGSGTATSGGITITTQPLKSTFIPAFPQWTTAVAYSINSIVVPTVSNGHYYKAVQGGVSGGVQPTFPTGTGQRVADGSIIWQEAGLINTAAPAPPAVAHFQVYAGSLWAFNTSVATTVNGLDGPSSLRMSDVNNMTSWNPINQAFLDKDDGLDGYGLATFTISAQGIPPEGSLIAFKRYQMYQIIGVFGADNFAIQRVLSDMGTIAPRTIQFIPGFGLGRLTHLGIGIFDGVNDRVVSEQIRPYLFSSPNDVDNIDIVPMDQQWMFASQGSQTGNPPMAIFAVPVGSGSGGALTRIFCYDLALKGWSVIDLPFNISTLLQVRTAVSQVVTLMGSFDDGTLQRWMAGDLSWATSTDGSSVPASIAWSVRLPSTAAKTPDQRLYGRRVVVSGQIGVGPNTMKVQPRAGGQLLQQQTMPTPGSGDFSVEAAICTIDRRFDAIVTGTGQVTIDGFDIQVEPKPTGVLAGAIS